MIRSGMRFTPEDAYAIASELQLPFVGFGPADLAEGMNVELEHGTADARTDVTHDDPYLTAKIASAHLYERPDYYMLLRSVEDAPRRPHRPRANPGLVVETIDHTPINWYFPHVWVWVINEPVDKPLASRTPGVTRGDRRDLASGWILMAGFEGPRPPPGQVAPITVTFEPSHFHWTITPGKKQSGRWGYPEGEHEVRSASGHGIKWWSDTRPQFRATTADPRLLGDWRKLTLYEATILQREYNRILPLLLAQVQ